MRARSIAAIGVVLGGCGGARAQAEPTPAPASSTSAPVVASAAPVVPAVPPAPGKSGPDGPGYSQGDVVVVSSDRRIAASLHDLRVQLWDWPTRAHLRELDESMCEEIVFAPDGKRLFVAHTNAPPSVVEDLAGTAKSRSFELPKGIPAEGDRGAGMLAVSSDGAWLVGRCDTVQVCLWSTKTGKGQRWTQPGTASPPKFLAFSQDNKRVLLKTEAATSFELEVPSLKPAAKEAGFKPERFD